MDMRRLRFAIVTVVVLSIFAASCARSASELPEVSTVAPGKARTATPAETATVAPSEDAAPAPVPVNYDVEIYGDLENLDPSGEAVVYWYPYTRTHEEIMLSLIDEFNRTNEWGIAVQGEYQGEYDDLHQKIITGIPDHRFPHITTAYQDRAATYAMQGALIPLDPYIESEKWGYTEEELKDFFPVALAADYLPQLDAHYGFPFLKSTEVMFYNEDWLAELGYDGPPESWSEFAEMACAAAGQPFSGATGDGGSYGYVYNVSASRFATFVFTRGGDIVNEDGTGYVFNDEAGRGALTFLKDLVDRGCAIEQAERYGDRNRFGAGQSLFAIGSTSGLSFYGQTVSEGAGFNWSIAPPPHTTDAPRMNIYGASLSIFVTSPEEQLAAWLFVKWLSEPEQQARWARSTDYLAIRRSTVDLLADDLAENPTREKALGFMALDYGVESPVAGYEACSGAISEMLVAVLGGEDAQTQLDAAVGQCNRYLQEAAF